MCINLIIRLFLCPLPRTHFLAPQPPPSSPQPFSVIANIIISSPARLQRQVSLFLIFFNVARALTGGVSRVAVLVVPRPHPALVIPPGARVDGSDGPRVNRWHQRCGVGGPEGWCRPHLSMAVYRWYWRCGVGGTDWWCQPRCSMAHALTGGIGVAAWAAPHPPPRARCAAILFGRAVAEEESALMAPVSTGGVGSGVARLPTRQVVDGPSFDGMCRPSCSMAHALTGGIGVSARAVPRPPPCARRPPGALIVDEWSWFF